MKLDFIYLPSKDVAKDLRYFTDVLGARFRFAVEGMGARVALVVLGDAPPRLLRRLAPRIRSGGRTHRVIGGKRILCHAEQRAARGD